MTASPTAVPVTVYGKAVGCQRCNITKRHLDRQGTPYEWVDVTEDAEGLARIQGLGYLEVPVVIAGDMHWGGYRSDLLDKLGTVDTFAADITGLDDEAAAYLADAEAELIAEKNPAAAEFLESQAAAHYVTKHELDPAEANLWAEPWPETPLTGAPAGWGTVNA